MDMADVSLFVSSLSTTSERRISPQWSISSLKMRLEPITGIPSTCQILELFIANSESPVIIKAEDEENTLVGQFNLVPYARLHV